jgi:hypothetical protein
MLRFRTQFCAFLGLASLAIVALPGDARAATVTLNFDVAPDGSDIPTGAIVDTIYAPFGVTFERVEQSMGGCPGTNVYANDRNDFASSPNVVTTCAGISFPSFNNSHAYVQGTLERDAIEVCVAVDPETDSDFGVLEIVDDMGTVLDSVTSTQAVQETICIQGDAIRFFRFAGDGRLASFDDLRITYAPNRIDFDSGADGADIADGTVIDTLFESEGVVFEKVNGSGICGGDAVYANADLPDGFGSSPNAVSICNNNFSDFSEDTHGRVRAFFARRANLVCIDALPSGDSDQAVLRAFNRFGRVVAKTLSLPGNSEERICVSSTTLRAVEFAGYQEGLAHFDNLEFTFGGATINFDVDTNAIPIPGGSVINSTYENAGVLLAGERIGMSCGTGDEVYANNDQIAAFGSPPNQVSLCNTNFSDFSENGQGMVHASFPLDALSVCVAVRATNAGDSAVLRSFDASDVQLDEVTSSNGATETLCIAGDGIRAVRFAGKGSRFARFDDLDVTFSPEPGSAALGAASLAMLAGLARRARRRARVR